MRRPWDSIPLTCVSAPAFVKVHHFEMSSNRKSEFWLKPLLTAAPERQFQPGQWVQVRSGGAPMKLVGYEESGDALCLLGGRTFTMPELLLRPVGEKPRRRGRKPGISPARLDADPGPAAEPVLAGDQPRAK